MKVLELAKPGGDLPAQLPVPGRRGLGAPAGRGAAADHRQAAALLRHRRHQGWPARSASAARINTVMQPCFFHLSGVLPTDEVIAADQGGDREGLRQARARRRRAQLRRHRPGDRRAGRGRRPRARRRRPAPDAAAARPGPGLRHRPSPRRMLAGEGDLLPVSAMPVDGTWPTGTARWEKRAIAQEHPDLGPEHLHRLRQVRDRLPAHRDPDQGLPARPSWTARRRASSPRRTTPATCPATGSPSRWRRTTAPAAGSASTSARPAARPRPSTSRSTWSRRSSTATRSGRTSTSSSTSPRSTAAWSGTTRSRASPSCSRCSSSPAPAPAAARRRTSRPSPSCSATGW